MQSNKTESDIQSEIIEWFYADGWFVIKIMVANKSGYTDLIVFKYGRIVWIEIKVPGKELEPLQEFRRDQLLEHKLEHHVFYSVNDVIKLNNTSWYEILFNAIKHYWSIPTFTL